MELSLKEYAAKHNLVYATLTARARTRRLPCIRLERRSRKGSLTFIYDEAVLDELIGETHETGLPGITLREYCDKHSLRYSNVDKLLRTKGVKPVGTVPSITGAGKPANVFNEFDLNKAMTNVFKRRGEVK